MSITRTDLDALIDTLSPDSLAELALFVGYLKFKEQSTNTAWVRQLYDLFAPLRAAAAGMSEPALDRLIDEALDDVRHA